MISPLLNPALAVLLSCIGSELFARLPFARSVARLGNLSARASHTVLSRTISDHWKERAVRHYSLAVAKQTLLLTGCFALVAAVFGLPVLALDKVAPKSGMFMDSPAGLALIALAGTGYYFARRRLARG